MVNECSLSDGVSDGTHRFQRGLHESILQTVQERLCIPFVYLAFEHAADPLDCLFTVGPIVLRLFALTMHGTSLAGPGGEDSMRLSHHHGDLPRTAEALKRTRFRDHGLKQSIAPKGKHALQSPPCSENIRIVFTHIDRFYV